MKKGYRECCDYIVGNNLDIEVFKNDCEIKVDIEVSPAKETVRIWGQVKDCHGCPVGNTLIKLVKVYYICGKCEYIGVAHTISDCEGFYQFEVCVEDEDKCQYKILVGKAATGAEREIKYDGNCDPCNTPCDPCEPCDCDDDLDCGCFGPYKKKY